MSLVKYFKAGEGPVNANKQNPLPVTIVGGLTPDDGSVGTEQLQDGAVTDAKLAKAKVDVPNPLVPKMVIGTTLETNALGIVGYEQTPTADHLAMYQFGGQEHRRQTTMQLQKVTWTIK